MASARNVAEAETERREVRVTRSLSAGGGVCVGDIADVEAMQK